MDRFELQQHASDSMPLMPGRVQAVYRPAGVTKAALPAVFATLTVLLDEGGVAASGVQPLHGRNQPKQQGGTIRAGQLTVAIADFRTAWVALWPLVPPALRPEHPPHQPRKGDTFCALDVLGKETDEVWRVAGEDQQTDHGGFLVVEVTGGVGPSR